jgi:hypothetical protein
MTPCLSQRQFARLVGVSQQAVNKAIRAGNVHDVGYGVDPEHPINILYAERNADRAADEGRPPTPWELGERTPPPPVPGQKPCGATVAALNTEAAVDAQALAVGRRIAALPAVERQILELLLSRLELGLDEYGAWPTPAKEHRNLEREMLEEAVDFVAYGAAALLRVRAGGES